MPVNTAALVFPLFSTLVLLQCLWAKGSEAEIDLGLPGPWRGPASAAAASLAGLASGLIYSQFSLQIRGVCSLSSPGCASSPPSSRWSRLVVVVFVCDISSLVTFCRRARGAIPWQAGAAFPPLRCATVYATSAGPAHAQCILTPTSFQVRGAAPGFQCLFQVLVSSSGLMVTHLGGEGGRMEGRALGVGVPELGVPV